MISEKGQYSTSRNKKKEDIEKRIQTSSVLEFFVVILAILIGLYFCMKSLDLFLFGDEFHSLKNIGKPYSEIVSYYDTYGSGTALPLMQRFIVQIIGPGLFAYRLPAYIGAMMTLLLMFPTASRLVGPVPAAVATLALSLNSMHIFYSGFGRSYSLMIAFSLLFVYAMIRATDQSKAQPFWFIILALVSGLLPYFHLSASGFVAVIGLVAILSVFWGGKGKTHGPWIIGSLFFGATICISLYLPAWETLWEFIQHKAGEGDLSLFNFMDVLLLLAGSRVTLAVWLLGIPVASVWILVKRREKAILLISAVLAPMAILYVTKPYGMAYAYARYLLIAMPFMLMLLSWLLVELLNRVWITGNAPKIFCLVAGIAFTILSFIAGPFGLRHTPDGPFSNTYLSMMPLPAFDVPWDKIPQFYKTLAQVPEPLQIIEAPVLTQRTVQLYRNYYLQHRKNVIMGFWENQPEQPKGGPYVWLDNIQSLKNSGSDYLILHLDTVREVDDYWNFVYHEIWPSKTDPKIHSLMFRQKTHYEILNYDRLDSLANGLQNRLGKPIYMDQRIAVWEIK